MEPKKIEPFTVACTVSEFVVAADKNKHRFQFTNEALQTALDKDNSMTNRGGYFEAWVKLWAYILFANSTSAVASAADKFYKAPLTAVRLFEVCKVLGIESKAGGNCKADALFEDGQEPTSIKYIGGGAASLAAYARRSLFLQNPKINKLEEPLTNVFKELFQKYPDRTYFKCKELTNPTNIQTMKQLIKYYCTLGTAKGDQENPVTTMLVLTNPLDPKTYFAGDVNLFIKEFWNTMSWEFRSRAILSKEGLKLSQIKRLIIDMEWNNPYQNKAADNEKPKILFGMRVGKIGKKRKATVDGSDASEPDKKRQQLKEMKLKKDAELKTLLEQFNIPLQSIDKESKHTYGSVGSTWHLNNKAYELSFNLRKIPFSATIQEAEEAAEQIRAIQGAARILYCARKLFQLKLKEKKLTQEEFVQMNKLKVEFMQLV